MIFRLILLENRNRSGRRRELPPAADEQTGRSEIGAAKSMLVLVTRLLVVGRFTASAKEPQVADRDMVVPTKVSEAKARVLLKLALEMPQENFIILALPFGKRSVELGTDSGFGR